MLFIANLLLGKQRKGKSLFIYNKKPVIAQEMISTLDKGLLISYNELYMKLTSRQETILDALVKAYIDSAEPISSSLLKHQCHLTVSSATIRNDLGELTSLGLIMQPHTSAGRVPTEKAYRYFVDKLYGSTSPDNEEALEDLIAKEVKEAKKKVEEELQLVKELAESLVQISLTLQEVHSGNKEEMLEVLGILGPSRTTYDKNISLIQTLIEELEQF